MLELSSRSKYLDSFRLHFNLSFVFNSKLFFENLRNFFRVFHDLGKKLPKFLVPFLFFLISGHKFVASCKFACWPQSINLDKLVIFIPRKKLLTAFNSHQPTNECEDGLASVKKSSSSLLRTWIEMLKGKQFLTLTLTLFDDGCGNLGRFRISCYESQLGKAKFILVAAWHCYLKKTIS